MIILFNWMIFRFDILIFRDFRIKGEVFLEPASSIFANLAPSQEVMTMTMNFEVKRCFPQQRGKCDQQNDIVEGK